MNNKQRQTLAKIFEQPERADIPWVDIEKLFEALGAEIYKGSGSRIRVSLKERRAVFYRPHPEKETNKPPVRSVRRFLKETGVNYNGI